MSDQAPLMDDGVDEVPDGRRSSASKIPMRVHFQDGTEITFAFDATTPALAMKEEICARQLRKHNQKLISPEKFTFKLVESGLILKQVETMADVMEANASSAKTEAAKSLLAVNLVLLEDSFEEDKDFPARVRLPNWTHVTLKVRPAMTVSDLKNALAEKISQKVDVVLLTMDHYKLKLRLTSESMVHNDLPLREVLLLDVFAEQPMHKLLELSLEQTGNFPCVTLMEGNLKKQQDVLKQYKDRFIRLTTQRISWFSKRGDKDERNGFEVSRLSVIVSPNDTKAFSVECDGRTIHLLAPSEDSCREWVVMLDTAVQMYRSHRVPMGIFKSKHSYTPIPRPLSERIAGMVSASISEKQGSTVDTRSNSMPPPPSLSVTPSPTEPTTKQLALEASKFNRRSLIPCETTDDTTAAKRAPEVSRAMSASVVAQSKELQNLAAHAQNAVGADVLSAEALSLLDSDYVKPLPVVLDLGSWACRAGFGGYEQPVCSIPTLCGRVRNLNRPQGGLPLLGMAQHTSFVGTEAMNRRGILSLRYPLDRGRVVAWDDLEAVLEFALTQALKVVPEERDVLMSLPPFVGFNPRGSGAALETEEQRAKLCEIMFESFNVPSIALIPQPMLLVYGTASLNALVVDIGECSTRCYAVWDGFMLADAQRTLEVGGRQLTEWMLRLLSECDFNIDQHRSIAATPTSSEFQIVAEMKAKLCFVSTDFDNHVNNFEPTKYNLADGREVVLGNQTFRCPEALFAPKVLGTTAPGIHLMIKEVLDSCPMDTRKDLCNNIVLSGSSANFPGLKERLTSELQRVVGQPVNVVVPETPEHAVWRGGSILSSVPSFSHHWVSSQEYAEHGLHALQRDF